MPSARADSRWCSNTTTAQPIAYLNEFLTFKEGKLYANDRPGLGVTVNMDRVKLVATITEPGRIGRRTGRTARKSRGNPRGMFQNYIGGEWVDGRARARQHQPVRHPATSSASARSRIRTGDRGDHRCGGGLRRWSSTTIQQRADALDRIGSEILARQAELGDLLAREEGEDTPEARGEVGRAGQIFKFSPARRCGPPAS